MATAPKIRSWRKFAAGSLAAVFFYSTAAAPWAEASFWQERRKAVKNASRSPDGSLLARLPGTPSLKASSAFPPSSPALLLHGSPVLDSLPASSQPGWLKALPLSRVDIQEAAIAPGSSRWVVLIQDVHGQEEAQRNIAEAVAEISALSGSKAPLLVGLEGASGLLDFGPYRSLADPDVVRETADHFLSRGLIAGTQYAGLTMERPAVFVGLEDLGVYGANIVAFQESRPHLAALELRLSEWNRSLAGLKAAHFSPELLDLDRRRARYARNEVPLQDHLGRLKALGGLSPSRAPHAARFLAAMEMEKSLDFKAVEAERALFLETLAKSLSEGELARLVDLSLSYRLGNLTPGAYYHGLRRLCRSRGQTLSPYPSFKRYLDYITLAHSIDRRGLFGEILRGEKEAAEKLFIAPRQREIWSLSEDAGLFEKMARQNLMPQEWDLYLSRAAAIRRLDERLRQAGGSAPPPEAERLSGAALAETFERFYAAARRRDTILADNLLREMDGRDSAGGPAAVVVAGGFHAPGLQARLRDGGCNVLVLAPRLSKVDSAHYMAAFTRERTPLDKVLLGEKLFLVYPLVLGSKRVLKKYEADVRKLDTFFPAVAAALAVKSLGSAEEAAVRRTLAAMLARLEASGLSSSIEDIQPSDDPKALLVTVQTPATSEAPARRRTLTFLVGPDIEKSIKRLSRRHRLVDRGQEFAVLATTGEPWSWKSLGRRLPPIPALPLFLLFLSAVHMISTGLQNPWAPPLSVLLAGELIRRTAGLYSLPLPMNGSLQDVSPRIIIADDADGLGERTAEKMADLIERNNRTPGKATVLGLATGGTVVPVYKAFVRLARARNLDLSRVHTFNLDEYAGLPPGHEQSYRYFMDKHLFSLVDIPPQNIHFLNGMVDRRDPRAVEEECARFEKEIRGLGGIDLQLLGIGPKRDVHIGFNHKGTPLGSRTHVVKLPRAVRQANSRFFGDDINQVPTHALTMGISTILDAREIILAANGAHKALSVRKALFNRMGSRTPASFLRLHPKVLFILDRAAAGLPGAGRDRTTPVVWRAPPDPNAGPLEERKRRALDVLRGHGQEHVLAHWQKLTNRDRRALLDQIESTDWPSLMGLHERKVGTPQIPRVPEDFRPVEPTPATFDEEALGREILRWGRDEGKSKLAGFLVAGGSGSGLGYDHPKGMFPALPLSRKTMYRSLVEKHIAAAQAHGHGKMFPLVVMLSDDTREETLKYFKDNDYFGQRDRILLVDQSTLPVFDKDGKVVMKSKSQIYMGGAGHGDALDKVLQSPKVKTWLEGFGVEYVQYMNVDNLLTPLADPGFLGAHARSRQDAPPPGRAHISVMMIPKDGEGRLGNIVEVEGVQESIDYGVSPETDEASPFGNPSIMLVTLQSLEGSEPLDFSVARKTVVDWRGRRVDVLKLERSALNKRRYGRLVAGAGKKVFAPVKVPGDVPRAARLLSDHWKEKIQAALETAGRTVEMPGSALVELPWDADYLSPEELARKLRDIDFPDILSPDTGYWARDGFSDVKVSSLADKRLRARAMALLRRLLGKTDQARIKNLRKAHREAFGREAAVVSVAPGRANIIGEHVDYPPFKADPHAENFSLPFALPFNVMVAANKRDDRRVRLRSMDYEADHEFSLDELDGLAQDEKFTAALREKNLWAAYVMGLLYEAKNQGHRLSGMEITVQGNVPLGAGMSSSAAYSVAVTLAAKDLFGWDLEGVRAKAEMARKGEVNPFVETNVGLLDQTASLTGKKDTAVLINYKDLSTEEVTFDLGGHAFVLVNSNVGRSLKKTEYNTRVLELSEAPEIMNGLLGYTGAGRKLHVSAFTLEEFNRIAEPFLKAAPVHFKRVRHVLTERQRTLDLYAALAKGNIEEAGRLLDAGGDSLSMGGDFQISGLPGAEPVPLDVLVRKGREAGAYGRMMGGGGGGSAIFLVKKDGLRAWKKSVGAAYKAATGLKADFYEAAPSDGARVAWRGSGESESWWHRSRLNPATAAGTRVQRGLNLTVGLVYSLSIVAAQVLSGQIMGDLQIAAANALLGTAIMVRHRYTRAAVIDMAVLFMAFNLITAFVMRSGALAIAAGVGTIILSMAVGSPQLSVEHPNLRKILGRFNGHNGRARSGNGAAAMRGLGNLLKRINPAADDSIRFYRRLTMVAPYALIIGFESASWLLKMDPVGLAIAQGVASIGLGLAVRSRFARGLAMFASAQLMIKDMAFIAAGMDPGLYLLAMAPAWIGWNMAQNAPGWGNGPLKLETWLTSRWRGKRRESSGGDVVSGPTEPARQPPADPSATAGDQTPGVVNVGVRPKEPGVFSAGRPASAMEHPLLQEAQGRNGDGWRTHVRGAGWNFANIQALKFYRPFSFFFSLAFVSYGLIQAALGVQPLFMAIAAGGGLVALSIGSLYIYRPGYRRAALYTEIAAVLFSLVITLMQGDPKVFLNAFPGALVAVSILAGYVPLKAPEKASGAKRLIRKAEETFFKALPLAASLASVAGLAFFPLALLGIVDLSTAALTAVSSMAANIAISNSNMALNLTRRKYGPFNPFRFRAGPVEEPAGGRPEASAPVPSAAPAIRAEQGSAADAERAPPTASRKAMGRSALLFFVSAGFVFGLPVLSGLLHTAGIHFPLAGFVPNQPISLLLGLAASAGFMLIDNNKGVPIFPEGIRYLRQDLFTRRSRPLFEVKHDIKDPGAIFDGEKTHIFTSLGSIQNERWKIAHITSKTTYLGTEAPEAPDQEWNEPEDVDLVWEPLKAVLREEEFQALMAGRGYAMAAPGMYYEEIGEGEPKHGVFHMYLQTDSFILGGIIFHLTSTDGGKTFVAQDIVARASNIPGRPFAGMYDPEPFEDDNGEKYLILSGMDEVKKPEIYLLKSESKTWSGPWTPVSEKPLFGFDHPDVQGLVNQPEDSAFEWGFEGAQIFKFKVDGQTKYGLLGAMFFKSGDSGTRQRLFFAVADKVDGPYRLAGPIIDPSAPDAGVWEEHGENGHGSIHYRKAADGKGNYYLFYQARAPGKDWRNGLAIFEEDPLADYLANFLPSSRNAAPAGLGSQTNQTAAAGTNLKTDQNLEQPGIERRPAVSPGGVVQHFNIVRSVKKHGLPWGLFWVSSHTIAPAFLFHLNPFLGGLAAAIPWGEFVIGFYFRKWKQNRRQAGLAAAPPAAERSGGRDYFPAQAEETRRMWERLFRGSYATRSAGQEAVFTGVYESLRYWGWTAPAAIVIHFVSMAPGLAWLLMAAASIQSFRSFREADPSAPLEVGIGLTVLYALSAGLAAALGDPWLLALVPAGWAGHAFHDRPLLAVRRIPKPFDLRSHLLTKYGTAALDNLFAQRTTEQLEDGVYQWIHGPRRESLGGKKFLMRELEALRPDIDENDRERIVILETDYFQSLRHFRRVIQDRQEKAPNEMLGVLSRLKELKKLIELHRLSGDLGAPPNLDEFYDILLLELLKTSENLFTDEAENLAAAVSFIPALQDKAEEWLKMYIVPDEPYHGLSGFQRDDGTWEEFEYLRFEFQHGRSQGGTRYEYDGNGRTFLEVLGLSLAMRVKHPLMGNHFDGGKSGLVFKGKRGSYSDAELERAGRAFIRDLFKQIRERKGPSYIWQGGIAPDMGTSPEDMAVYTDEIIRIFLEQGLIHDMEIEKHLFGKFDLSYSDTPTERRAKLESEVYSAERREQTEQEGKTAAGNYHWKDYRGEHVRYLPLYGAYVEFLESNKKTKYDAFELGLATGKPIEFTNHLGKTFWARGSVARMEAAGFGIAEVTRLLKKHLGIARRKTTVALQGLGNVGLYTAINIAKGGDKIMRITEYLGGEEGEDFVIIEPLDPREGIPGEVLPELFDHLRAVRRKRGQGILDDGLESFKKVRFTRVNAEQDLLAFVTSDVDILIPAAGENVVTAENAHLVRARAVIPGGNGAVSPGGAEILAEKGIELVAHVQANGTATMTSELEVEQNRSGKRWSKRKIYRRLRSSIRTIFKHVRSESRRHQISLPLAAYIVSLEATLQNGSNGRRHPTMMHRAFHLLGRLWRGRHADIKSLFMHGVKSVDPHRLVKERVKYDRRNGVLLLDGQEYSLNGGNVYAIGMGKGADGMARALDEILGDRIAGGQINALTEGAFGSIKVTRAGHPLPTKEGVEGAEEMIRIVSSARPGDTVIAVVTGGGSALAGAPEDGLELEELQGLTKAMLVHGLDIGEINAVRGAVEKIKAGKLRKMAPPGVAFLTLAVSDVPTQGNLPSLIASGPTVAGEASYQRTWDILHGREGLWEAVPDSFKGWLELLKDDEFMSMDRRAKEAAEAAERASHDRFIVLANNDTAVQAMAREASARGYEPLVVPGKIHGDVAEAAERIYNDVWAGVEKARETGRRVAILWGGEPTVHVTAAKPGRSGRNSHLALLVAKKLHDAGLEEVLFLSGATDGMDGNSEFAGAVGSARMVKKAASRGLSAEEHAARFDAASFFEAAGGALKTGPTGTTVADVMVALVKPTSPGLAEKAGPELADAGYRLQASLPALLPSTDEERRTINRPFYGITIEFSPAGQDLARSRAILDLLGGKPIQHALEEEEADRLKSLGKELTPERYPGLEPELAYHAARALVPRQTGTTLDQEEVQAVIQQLLPALIALRRAAGLETDADDATELLRGIRLGLAVHERARENLPEPAGPEAGFPDAVDISALLDRDVPRLIKDRLAQDIKNRLSRARKTGTRLFLVSEQEGAAQGSVFERLREFGADPSGAVYVQGKNYRNSAGRMDAERLALYIGGGRPAFFNLVTDDPSRWTNLWKKQVAQLLVILVQGRALFTHQELEETIQGVRVIDFQA